MLSLGALWRSLGRRRLARRLQRHAIADEDWEPVFARLPLLHRLDADERRRLRELATLFLAEKRLVPLQGLQLTRAMAVTIAAQACLLILHFPQGARGGMEWYRGWETVLLYPTSFRVSRTEVDEYGVAHELDEELAGESWEQAGVILSWEDTAQAGQLDGYNLVIHEFAHKLDMLTGDADGCPPLPAGLDPADWYRVFNKAFEAFNQQVSALGEDAAMLAIDPYAASAPAEFFAVLSEYFFECPDIVQGEFPDVYRLLVQYYRQSPLPLG